MMVQKTLNDIAALLLFVSRQFPVERLVDKRVHSLSNTHHSCEHDTPCVGAVE